MPIDVALIQVSPPDRHGYCSLGVSVDVTLAAVQTARLCIAQVNPNMPRTSAAKKNLSREVDLTGQVCADSIGSRQYSGVGGQMDFIRGAALSEGGKPIIALPAHSHKGDSRIVPLLRPGAGVTTTRAHVHYVVTEYGVANLYGKNLRQRALSLIGIAHPEHRAALAEAARLRFGA